MDYEVTAPTSTYILSSTALGLVIIKINTADDNSGVKSITLHEAPEADLEIIGDLLGTSIDSAMQRSWILGIIE